MNIENKHYEYTYCNINKRPTIFFSIKLREMHKLVNRSVRRYTCNDDMCTYKYNISYFNTLSRGNDSCCCTLTKKLERE